METPPNIPIGKGSISHSIRDELFSTGSNISRFLESSDSGSPPVIKITDDSENDEILRNKDNLAVMY